MRTRRRKIPRTLGEYGKVQGKEKTLDSEAHEFTWEVEGDSI